MVNPEPSGVRSDTPANCTEPPPEVVDEYIVTSVVENMLMLPVTDAIVAVQFVKVTFPKSASGDTTRFTVGLSTIHSADN